MAFDKAMQRALEADGEKLRQLTGADHGPHFVQDDGEFAVIADRGVIAQFAPIVAVDAEIFDLVAPRLISFSDAQLARLIDLARSMPRAKSERFLREVARRISGMSSDRDIWRAIESAAATG
jgi:hypothetical protein